MTSNKQNSDTSETSNTSCASGLQEPASLEKQLPNETNSGDISFTVKVVKLDTSANTPRVPLRVDLSEIARLEYVREMNEQINKM